MSLVTCLSCVQCGRSTPTGDSWTCPTCGPDEGILDVLFDLDQARKTLTRETLAFRRWNQWRYSELLPLSALPPEELATVGWTHVIEAPRLADALGVRRLRLKDDGRNPSGSFKDRPSALAIAMAIEESGAPVAAGPKPRRAGLEQTRLLASEQLREWRERDLAERRARLDHASGHGIASTRQEGQFASPVGANPAARAVACASTGNAASSLAHCAAAAGLARNIFVPGSVPEGKLAQLLAYGARVFKIRGTYAQAYDLCTQACERFGWYNRNCAINPYLVEGKKTGGMEVAEQCADDPPQWVAVSVGDGCTIAGIHKGIAQMKAIGIIDWDAKMLGVQAAGVAPIAEAARTGRLDRGGSGTTYADSINCAVPRNWRKAVNAVRESGGAWVGVTDEQIMQAVRETGRLSGVFAEPAAAAAVAGVAEARAKGLLDAKSDVVVMITGNGLKDVGGALKAVGQPHEIAPDIGEVERLIGDTQSERT